MPRLERGNVAERRPGAIRLEIVGHPNGRCRPVTRGLHPEFMPLAREVNRDELAALSERTLIFGQIRSHDPAPIAPAMPP